jgi:hypothetical protein
MPSWNDSYAGVDREAIWAALFAYLQTQLSASFVTMGRKHIQPPALSLDAQPALFLLQIRERRQGSKRGLPNEIVLHGLIVLYVPAPATDELPGQEQELAATALNGFFQAIDDAMRPDNQMTGKFTIGGLVEDCAIEGEVDQDPGIFGPQAAAILPIRIVVP